MTWVKICGLTSDGDVAAAVAAGADAVGFNTWDGSPRGVSPAQAAVLGADAGVPRYLVTVDLAPEALLEQAAEAEVEGVQPHGRYAPEAVSAALQAGLAVLYPLRVSGVPDLASVPAAAVPLLDTAVAGLHGGTGTAFDWRLAAGLGRRVVVAGGLSPQNVAEAVAVSGAWGVDVASGVESAPGVKDPAAMQRFVEAVR
jgi:phosphoribosylanthranilate isomerase